MSQPDILVFLSDQHNARFSGMAGDPVITTPNMDRLTEEGTVFEAAYTACPLCVPARCSMLTGQLPSRTGIFDNNGVIPSDQATFVHSLAAAGYETVLCGRMHFVGPDQRHGFTKRLVGDFTPCYHGRYGNCRSDLGPYVGTPGHQFSKLYGGGTSPVLEYDKAVISAALDYLRKPHDRPIFLLVGTYGPHHTFVAPEDLYRKYLETAPALHTQFGENSSIHSLLKSQRRDFEPELIHQLRAAYYGMVETLDHQIGEIHQAWADFLRTNDRKGLFCYLSDHGEQAGERGLWGKMSFYEESARIPFLFTGTDVQSGVRVSQPSSMMDLGPTLCEIAGAESPPEQDGESLGSILQDGTPDEERTIFSELLQSTESGYVPARMVRKGKWKYISYAGYGSEDQLFNMEKDVYEEQNCLLDFPEVADELREALTLEWDPKKIVSEHERREKHWQLLSKWGSTVDVPEPDRWPIPSSAWQLPKP